MRVAVILWLVLASACSIRGDRFFGPGGGDGGGDGPGDGSGSDGPQAGPFRHGYILDCNAGGGLFRVDKDANGNLTLADSSPVPAGTPIGAFTNKQGTHLYVMDGSTQPHLIRDFVINSDGTIFQAAQQQGVCSHRFAALHPSGTFAVLGCSAMGENMIGVMSINADGSIANITTVPTSGTTPHMPVFTADGRCMYVTDADDPAFLIHEFAVDTPGRNVIENGVTNGPKFPFGIAVHPNMPLVFVAGQMGGGVDAYQVTPTCKLSQVSAELPVGPSTQQLVVHPSGERLFVAGTEVFEFFIETGTGTLTDVPGSPFLGGTSIDGATMDPLLPSVLYLTGRNIGGTMQALVDDPGGDISPSSTLTTNHSGSLAFVMAP